MNQLSRAGVVGFLLSVFAIILFVVLWIVFGQSGMEAFPRLVLSLCLPPAALALMMGIYVLVKRPKV